MLPWLYYALLLVLLVSGWGLNILGLPGLWVMLLGHVAFAWATGWGHYTGWTAVVTLFALALAAEVIEFVAGAAGSKKAGGTKRGMLGAVGGGLAGGIAGSFLIPVPVVGTIVGAVGGSFLGAGAIEKLVHPDNQRALKIAYGAAKGRLLGIVLKSGIGLVMGVVSVVTAFPVGPAAAGDPDDDAGHRARPASAPGDLPGTRRPDARVAARLTFVPAPPVPPATHRTPGAAPMTLDITPADTAAVEPTAPPDAPVRPLPWPTLLVMSAACGAGAANIYYCQPLLNDFAEQFHTSIDSAGLVATAAQVGYGVGILFFVPLGDLLERRRIVLTLAYACAALLAATALSPTLWTLIVAQLLVGVTAMSAQLLIPLSVDLSPPDQHGRVVGILMAGLLCGLLLARTLGGVVGDHFGWRAMFWLAAGLMLLTGGVCQAMLPARPPTLKIGYGGLMRSLWDLLRTQPLLRTAAFVSGTSFGAFCAFWAVLSFWTKDHFHRGATEAGLMGLVGLAGALFAPLAGRLSDRRGPAFTLTLAMLVSVASFVGMWLWTSWAGLIVGVLVLDLGVQSAQVAAQSEVMALVPGARSRLNTVYMVGRFIGGAAGSTVGTVAYARGGWTATCLTSAFILLAGTAAHLLGVRHRTAGVATPA